MSLKFTAKDIQIEKLLQNPDNLRFSGGSVVDGVKVTDTYNVGTMKDVIRAEGGIPGRLVVEDNGDGTFTTLAGNRRLRAAKEMVIDPSITVELVEVLKKLPCNVYKDLTERQRRDLVNDQRSQKYMRSEVDVHIWRLQSAGYTFPEIAEYIWPQFATYAGQGAQKLVEIEQCGSDADRKKVITTWLKGSVDNVILRCGKLGPRVRKAMLLYDMALDGISPIKGTDEKGQPIYELAEFKPTQGRCAELWKAQKADPNWTPEAGSPEFNALINKYILQDKGINPDTGEMLSAAPARASVELLNDQTKRTQSKACKVALEFAKGLKPLHYADVDNIAYRMEQCHEVMLKHRETITNAAVLEIVQGVLTNDPAALELILVKFS